MIPANELRLGNWVTWKGTPAQVVPQDFGDHTFHVIEPIPLTPEILEAAGFKEYSGKHFDGWAHYGEYKGNSPFEDGFVATLVIDDRNRPRTEIQELIIGRQLQYLHQLQNLYFALTGQELEIKLPVDQH